MVNLFDIKKVKKDLSTNNSINLEDYNAIASLSKEETLKKLTSNITGLTSHTAKERLQIYGKNKVICTQNKSWFSFLLESFKDEFILILFILAIVNLWLGEVLGSLIIIVIAFISALIKFFQNYSVYKFNNRLKAQLISQTSVVRMRLTSVARMRLTSLLLQCFSTSLHHILNYQLFFLRLL